MITWPGGGGYFCTTVEECVRVYNLLQKATLPKKQDRAAPSRVLFPILKTVKTLCFVLQLFFRMDLYWVASDWSEHERDKTMYYEEVSWPSD